MAHKALARNARIVDRVLGLVELLAADPLAISPYLKKQKRLATIRKPF
jgi:hypothetical protein